MITKSFILSSSGFKNVIKDEKQFTFIFGEKDFHMNSMCAEFLSPLVSHLHHSDPTIDSIHLQLPPNISKLNYISDDLKHIIIDLSNGSQVAINETQSEKIRYLSILLCNEELYSKMRELYPKENGEEQIQFYLDEIKMIDQLSKQNGSMQIDVNYLINMISSHLYCIGKEEIKNLPITTIQKILLCDQIAIESEDWLFDLINEIFSQNDECENLSLIEMYELIEVENLSESKFEEMLMRINPNEISSALWRNICKRLIRTDTKEDTPKTRYHKALKKEESTAKPVLTVLFDGKKENELNGIIRKLTQKCNGNVHDKGVVEVTASSDYGDGNSSSCKPKFAVDLDNKETRFVSKKKENSWLVYDFKEQKVQPTHYSITSRPMGKGDWHPMNWVIEGSNDNKEWKTLDSRQNISVLNGCNVTHTLQIQEKLGNNEYYRYLKIRQTGVNAAGSFYFGFSALEYFGTMI